jgi:hypothetical protein
MITSITKTVELTVEEWAEVGVALQEAQAALLFRIPGRDVPEYRRTAAETVRVALAKLDAATIVRVD